MMIVMNARGGRKGGLGNRFPRGMLALRCALAFCTVALVPIRARAQAPLRAVTDHTTYNVGSRVKARVIFSLGEFESSAIQILGAVRYAGDKKPLGAAQTIEESYTPTASERSTPYLDLWKIPESAATGRYDVDLTLRDAKTHHVLLNVPGAASFAVHRLLVRIERIELDRAFYISGDAVACRVTIKNLTDRALRGLRVEFSDRYWPWIAGPAEQAAASIAPIATSLTLAPGAESQIRYAHAAAAPEVSKPTFHQYGVVVWDHDRKNAYDIAFSPLVIVRPPGVDSPVPYPGQYVFPELSDVNVTAYRRFYPAALNSAAIAFDSSHTMFPESAEATASFSLSNPTSEPWERVSVVARLVDAQNHEVARQTVERDQNIPAGAAPAAERVRFKLPASAGLYRVGVTVTDSPGNILASNELELGVNALPKSILIFNAHEDDEGGWMALIRAAVENHIPLHLVYLTSGDAGSCDVYYERSCGPSEALNFGRIRMDETRAALGHLGVAASDIQFLGLPDGGSGEIWFDHLRPSNPYLAVLLASDHAPYAGLVRPNLPYARDAVLEVIKKLITKYKPAVVVTAHPPSQRHIDHIVAGYFAVKALEELARANELAPESVEVLVDRIYNPKTAPSTPYHYSNHVFYVSGEARALAQEAGWYYESQGGNRGLGRIRDFDQLSRETMYRQILDWMNHAGWNEKRPRAEGAAR